MRQVSTPASDSQRPKEMIYLSLSKKQIFIIISDDASNHSTLELSPLTVPSTTTLF